MNTTKLESTMWMQEHEVYLGGLPLQQHSQQQSLHPGIIGTEDRTHHHQQYRSTTMSSPELRNPRASRNMAEKHRRDILNTRIATMGSLVPYVANSQKKMDKNRILKLTTAFLRGYYTLGGGSPDFFSGKYGDIDAEDLIDTFVGSEAFVITVTKVGKIVYVSRPVKDHFGYPQDELIGSSLYSVVHPDDHEALTRNLTPDDIQLMMKAPGVRITEVLSDNSNSSDDSGSYTPEGVPFREHRRCFTIRMAEYTASKREPVQYEAIEISGGFKLADACKNQHLNRGNHREITPTSNDIFFVGIAHLLKKRSVTALSIMDAEKNEYITRHLVDGRLIYCDHRISTVSGYMAEEVSGRSAFMYMHKDDVMWTIIGLRQMYDHAEPYGTSCYRLRSKTGVYIYLRTCGFLEYMKETQTVVSFVCINTLVPEEEGLRLIKEMKERYSATISETTRAMIQNAGVASGSDTQLSNSANSLTDSVNIGRVINVCFSDLLSTVESVNSEESQDHRLQNLSTTEKDNLHNINGSNRLLQNSVSPALSTTPAIQAPVKPCSPGESPKQTMEHIGNGVIENGISPKTESHQQRKFKRTNSEDNTEPIFTKKRPATNGDLFYNSNVMMGILNNEKPAMDIDTRPSHAEVQQLMQDVSKEILRAHATIAERLPIQGTQLDLLKHDVDNWSLPEHREELTRWEAEYKKQNEMLKTLQQDHRNLQVNVKYNIGV